MIRNVNAFEAVLPAGFDGLFHWDFLDPAWQRPKTKITPMDIDAVVERNGVFLMFETKSAGALIPPGQHISLSRLVRLGRGAITVISLQTKHAADITKWEVWRYEPRRDDPDGVDRRWYFGNAVSLLEFCGQWFVHASDVRVPPLYSRIDRPDLFASLISNPVERATVYLHELTDIERAYVLDRFRGA